MEKNLKKYICKWNSIFEKAIYIYKKLNWGFPGGSVVKNPPAMQETSRRHGFDPWVRKIPWRRTWQPTPVFLPGEFQRQRSVAGYSPWGHKRVGQDFVSKQHN